MVAKNIKIKSVNNNGLIVLFSKWFFDFFNSFILAWKFDSSRLDGEKCKFCF